MIKKFPQISLVDIIPKLSLVNPPYTHIQTIRHLGIYRYGGGESGKETLQRELKVPAWCLSREQCASKMGKGFGNLGVKVKNVVTFSISPFEQRALAGVWSKGLPNNWRRYKRNIIYIGLPVAFYSAIYSWATKKNGDLKRKNPDDYINDV